MKHKIYIFYENCRGYPFQAKVKFRMKRKLIGHLDWLNNIISWGPPLLLPCEPPLSLLMTSSPWPCTDPIFVHSLGCWTRSVSRSLLLPPPPPSLPYDSADVRGVFDCCESVSGGQEVGWCARRRRPRLTMHYCLHSPLTT